MSLGRRRRFPFLDTTGPLYPQPVYPQSGDRTTRAGTCAKGWIVFAVATGTIASEASYESDMSPNPLVWNW